MNLGPPASRGPDPPVAPKMPGRGARLIVLVALLLAMYVIARLLFQSFGGQSVPYSQFQEAIESGKVRSVEIGEGWAKGYAINIFAPPTPEKPGEKHPPAAHPPPLEPTFLQTDLVRGTEPALAQMLASRSIPYTAVRSSTWLSTLIWWVLPFVVLFFFWGRALRRIGPGVGGPGGILSFGKMQARIVAESETGVGFADVAGVDEAVEELREIVDFLRVPEKFRRLGARIPKGVLLVGPPGTGKTLLARAVAGEAHAPFFSLTASQFVEMFVGVGAARVRDLFTQAQQRAPCIIFIDELDAIGRSRGSGIVAHEEREQTLNQLLAEMDGFDPRVGLIVLAATNRPEILDPALLRPGRFDRQVLVDRPDKKGREQILKIHARKVRLAPDVDFRDIAAETAGFAGADLANLVNEAALLAARRGAAEVARADLNEAIERVTAGLEKKGRRLDAREREVVAHHEAGHAVVGWLLSGAERVRKVSIVPRGIAALGYTRQSPTEDRFLMSQPELTARIATLLGGRAAEEMVFGEISTGSVNDLQQATAIARAMIRDYGMSDKLGPVSLTNGHRPFLVAPEGAAPVETRIVSERTFDTIDAEVRRLLVSGQQTAQQVLTEHRDKLEAIAARLLKQEVVEEDELAVVLGPHRPSQTEAPAQADRVH